jgi:hypothetical protein
LSAFLFFPDVWTPKDLGDRGIKGRRAATVGGHEAGTRRAGRLGLMASEVCVRVCSGDRLCFLPPPILINLESSFGVGDGGVLRVRAFACFQSLLVAVGGAGGENAEKSKAAAASE